MKNLIKSVLLLFTLALVSCDSDTNDLMTSDSVAGGAIVKVMPSIGKALGTPQDPSDLDYTLVTFTDVELDLVVQLQFGGEDITKYEIVKTFLKRTQPSPSGVDPFPPYLPGMESIVASGASLPLNVHYTTMADYMANTEVSNTDDLNIGDQFIFRTKMYTASGAVHYANRGTYKVTVNCASDLAGGYHINYTSGLQAINVTEIAPGNYRSDYLPPFSNSYWFEFIDVCSSLAFTDWQYQGGNPITPFEENVGYVDGTTGDLVFEGVNVAGVSWYVGRDWTIYKN